MNCENCGSPFELKSKLHPNQRFCCPKCSKNFYYKTHKQQWKDHYDPEKNKIKSKIKYQKYKEKYLAQNKIHYQKNKAKIRARIKLWESKNKDKLKESKLRYKYDRYENDPQFNIKERLRARVRRAFYEFTTTGKIYNSKEYGIDYKAIIEHLKPFPIDIENWHIDHIIALFHFDLEDPEQIKIAFAPENHQWLLIHDNLVKGTK